MKVLLGAAIVLLALVSVGVAVYAYAEHREVAYLTLRADYLESRITELESAPSIEARPGEDEQVGGEESQGTYCDRNPDKRACLSYDSDQAREARGLPPLTPTLEALRWTEEDAIAVVQFRVQERLAACDAQDLRGIFPSAVGARCFSEDPVMWATVGFSSPSLVKVMIQHGELSARYEPDSYRWRIEASGQDVQPLVFHAYEKTGLVVGVAQ